MILGLLWGVAGALEKVEFKQGGNAAWLWLAINQYCHQSSCYHRGTDCLFLKAAIFVLVVECLSFFYGYLVIKGYLGFNFLSLEMLLAMITV